MKKLLKNLLNFIFPTRCVGCRIEGCFICKNCLFKIEKAPENKLDWITSVWSYKDKNIRKLIWLLKFKRDFGIIDDLVETLSEYLEEELRDKYLFDNFKNPVLVPIPLSQKSLRKRGFNQSYILAKALVKKSEGKLELKNDILFKNKHIKAQNSIADRKERFENIKGVFSINKNWVVKDRPIILIDDVTTTGATLLEARRILKDFGIKDILGFTIAH